MELLGQRSTYFRSWYYLFGCVLVQYISDTASFLTACKMICSTSTWLTLGAIRLFVLIYVCMYFFKLISFYLRNFTCDCFHCQSPWFLQSLSPHLQGSPFKRTSPQTTVVVVHNSFSWDSLISTWMWTYFKNSPPELTWNGSLIIYSKGSNPCFK